MKKDPALSPELDIHSLHALDWRRVLSDEEYRVLRESGTERPGTGRYLQNEAAGAYHCAGCGNRLYSGEHKFHSGCGWPSFYKEVEPGSLKTYRDGSHGMMRVEMRCGRCDGHLGHIFEDAPQMPGGLRHCVNGNALVFVPEGEDALEVIRKHRQG